VLPVAGPPLQPGWVAIDDGKVVGVGRERRGRPRGGRAERDLGTSALLPGLVNAHTHLELSYLRGAIPATGAFTDWVRALMRLRREMADPAAPPVVEGIVEAVREARASGTALVGDISNTLVSVPPLAASRLAACVFFELVRFRSSAATEAWQAAIDRLTGVRAAPHVRLAMAPHAPYSVSPSLFSLVRRALDRGEFARTSVHLAESPEECELLQQGTGPWRALLEDLQAWDPAWVPPGCSPVEYLDRLRFLAHDTLVVHGVHLTDGDLGRLAARGAVLVTCPRSNRHVGAGDPPVARFYAAGLRVAVGTDSLASGPDMNVFSELAAMRALAPGVPASRLIESATRVGAEALGFGGYGTIAPGTPAAALMAVDVPESVNDVEEYLVSGIPPDRVRWPMEES
jgi:cytosine/adenosine deaminase-related metal-dependent hydrolase